MLFGSLCFWWGIYHLGLGFRLRWLDGAAIVTAASLITWAFRNHLSHSEEHGLIAMLQMLCLGLLIAIGGVGLILHGLTMQMGGGRLAIVMRCIALYALTRSLLTLSQGVRDSFSVVCWLCFYSVPWIFAFGAAHAAWLTDTVRQSIRKQADLDWDMPDLCIENISFPDKRTT